MVIYYNYLGQVVEPTATDAKIYAITSQLGESTIDNLANVAAGVLGVDIGHLQYQTLYASGSDSETGYTIFQAGPNGLLDRDAAKGWLPLHDSPDIPALQQKAKNIFNGIKEPEPEPKPDVEPPATGSYVPVETPADQENRKGQGIFCWLDVGGTNASADVISMRSEINSSIEGGSPSAVCQIVLHNNRQKYGKLIAGGTWLCNQTEVRAVVYNYKNIASGNETSLERHAYVFFYGVLEKASFDATTCTLNIVSHDGLFQDAFDREQVFQVEDTVQTAATETAIRMWGLKGFDGVFVDALGAAYKPVQVKINASSRQSTIQNLGVIAMEYGVHFFTDVQQISQPTLVMCNDLYSSGFLVLDPYVTKQGYTMSSQGHANVIDVLVNTVTDPMDTRHDIPYSQNAPNHATTVNQESVDRYGVLRNSLIIGGNMAGGIENAQALAWNTRIKLDAKMDNRIEATVLGIIPKLWSKVAYTIADGADGSENVLITAKVIKETLEYSARGLIANLTMARIMPETAIAAEPSKEPPEPEPQKTYPVLSAEYHGTLDDPASGATYYSFQGKKDADGSIWYNSKGLVGDSSVGFAETSTGWTRDTSNVPAAIVVDINLDLAEQT